VNKAPALSEIKPGYRAIADWVRVRMIKETYARIRQNMTEYMNPTPTLLPADGGAAGGAAGTMPEGSGAGDETLIGGDAAAGN